MSDVILGVDVSKWNPGLDYKALYDGGIRFAIVKITSGDYSKTSLREEHINGFRNVGIEVGAYHWADPLIGDAKQIDYFAAEAQRLGVKVTAVDVEQFWADWIEWQQGNITKFLDPSRISQNAYNMRLGMENRNFNSLIYSRESFINEYARPMSFWIPPLKSWWAYWVHDPRTGRVTTSWEYFKENFLPKIPAPFSMYKTGCSIWQFTGDKFILPGTGGNPIDLNIWMGDMDSLHAYFQGESVVIPPTPEPEPTEFTQFKSLTSGLRIRSGPTTSAKIKGQLVYGETLELADNVIVKSDGYDWVPCKVWVAKGRTDGNNFGELL